MTPDDVRKDIQAIQAKDVDGDTRDLLYDGLRVGVLEAIAKGVCVDPAECARMALSVGWPSDG